MKPRKNQVFIEFKESSVHVLDGAEGAEFPVEREANGRITAQSAAVITNGLRGFLQRNGHATEIPAVCALPARGVTLRAFSLPATAKDDPGRLLAMQIEAQFPVAPSELAWGFSSLSTADPDTSSGANFLVAAVRRDLLQDYAALLTNCGLRPVFTVAGLARAASANGTPSFSLLEVGHDRSELIVVDGKSAPSLRVLNWGRAHGENTDSLRTALSASVAPVLYISSVHSPAPVVNSALPGSTRVEQLSIPTGPGHTAATHGLRALYSHGRPVLLLGAKEEAREKFVLSTPWKWAAAAVVLLCASFALRYAEPMFFQSQLNSKLHSLTNYRATLPRLERELSFLNYIQTNQPPYLDTIAVISSAAPPGTRIDQLSVVRRGDVSLRGSVQDPQGPEKFRSKLIDSGFFSKVVVEEQSPSAQDRNKISFRITGTLKPDGARKVLPPEPPLTNKTSSSSRPMPPGAMPPGMLPPGAMPPGAMPPGMMPPGAMPAGAMPVPVSRPMPITPPMP